MSTLIISAGERLSRSRIREILEAVSDELVRRGWPAVRVVSGDRAYELQVSIFLARYVLASKVAGRKVYDFQWWNGVLYARISAAGRVAPPSRSAPHVALIAADLGSPYNVYGAARNALLAVVRDLGLSAVLVNTGTGFGEVWHWEVRGGAGSTAASGGSNSLEEIMATLDDDDKKWLEGRLSGYFAETYRLLKVPGTAYSFAEAALNDVRGVAAVVAAIRAGDIKYLGTNWNAFETLTNVVREDDGRDMAVPDLDEDALAAALAPSLAPLLADHLGTLSDETLDKIAKRSADEQARRLAS